MKSISSYLLLTLIITLSGCATYYQKNLKFQQSIYEGNFEKADATLAKIKKADTNKDRLLYFLNRGYTNWVLDQNEQSNLFFEKADHYIEDYQKNYAIGALAMVTNPMVNPYQPEDFESVMLHYFTTLNYINLGKMEDAEVECRRINIILNKLNDKYPKYKNRYKRDAFAETLSGLIYDANRDYNNAFIAYRNALEIYETDYVQNFQTKAPLQLKKDLLRTAYLTGFDEELHQYEEKFGMKYDPNDKSDASLVFFWMNGFGPIKDEWSINFVKFPGDRDGWIVLANQEYGLSFPIYIGDYDNQRKQALSDLSMMRVAFPKYVERPPLFTGANISKNGQIIKLEEAQNINDIAFKTLKDRMFREMATSIARLALKKAMEAAVRKQDQGLGAVLSVANALTEKADTRNWQTLPYSISYTRIPLNEGANDIVLSVSGNGQSRDYPFHFEAKKGQTLFHAFHNIEIKPFELGR
jgi:hypothetical protein